jgi:hypothetical protein
MEETSETSNNVKDFYQELMKNFLNNTGFKFSAFTFACVFNDIYLREYKYAPVLNEVNTISHEWVHLQDNSKITIRDIRVFVTKELIQMIYDTMNRYIVEMNNPQFPKKNVLLNQEKVKKLGDLSLHLQSAEFYFKFVEYLPLI